MIDELCMLHVAAHSGQQLAAVGFGAAARRKAANLTRLHGPVNRVGHLIEHLEASQALTYWSRSVDRHITRSCPIRRVPMEATFDRSGEVKSNVSFIWVITLTRIHAV